MSVVSLKTLFDVNFITFYCCYILLFRRDCLITATSPPTPNPTYSITTSPSFVPLLPTLSPLLPTLSPSYRPSYPTSQPSRQPSRQPLRKPSRQPIRIPSAQPSRQPFRRPTRQPTRNPLSRPSIQPSLQPSAYPSHPSTQPSSQPSRNPRGSPTQQPSRQPFVKPSCQPSYQPTSIPSTPTSQPTSQPSKFPRQYPSRQPSRVPTSQPTRKPAYPSMQPTKQPSKQPIMKPSRQPVRFPSSQPSMQPLSRPSIQPTKQPFSRPSNQPDNNPTRQPIRKPSSQPSKQPVRLPSKQPSFQPQFKPSDIPSCQPRRQPSSIPSKQPSMKPSIQPKVEPTIQPSGQPREKPSKIPSMQPTYQPSSQPKMRPSRAPSRQPSRIPTGQPKFRPSNQPFKQPSHQPSKYPSSQPTKRPSFQPYVGPTFQPYKKPSIHPSAQPVHTPTIQPTLQPTQKPRNAPSKQPTFQPIVKPTSQPSSQPNRVPSKQPLKYPTTQPTAFPSVQPQRNPSRNPSSQPVEKPTKAPTSDPSRQPSKQPSCRPFCLPTKGPSWQPIRRPTKQPFIRPSNQPSMQPNTFPSSQPFRSPVSKPSSRPSKLPSSQPTGNPSNPTDQPTFQPTVKPTSSHPTGGSTRQPTNKPSIQPSEQPSRKPSSQPYIHPSMQPSKQPIIYPSQKPSIQPHSVPSNQPVSKPSKQPTQQPMFLPTHQPSEYPTSVPSLQSVGSPTSQPHIYPSNQPSSKPTSQPTLQPSQQPSSLPSAQPSLAPSIKPSHQPSIQPHSRPSLAPSHQPLGQPTNQPLCLPSRQPTCQPFDVPTLQPFNSPTSTPSSCPSRQPNCDPSYQPSSQPLRQPSGQPSLQPSRLPSKQPSVQPTQQPFSIPTNLPSVKPSHQPVCLPSRIPTVQPFKSPTLQPSLQPSLKPSRQPQKIPTLRPTIQPSKFPSYIPTCQPLFWPTLQPIKFPSFQPSKQPQKIPSRQPLRRPTSQPTVQPFRHPTSQPITAPSFLPSSQPDSNPTAIPSNQPYSKPTCLPTSQPSKSPTEEPSSLPSLLPSFQPQSKPTLVPFSFPTVLPSHNPTVQPSSSPLNVPSDLPTSQPSWSPSIQPTRQPSVLPSGQPFYFPSSKPSLLPTLIPSHQPDKNPTKIPTVRPSMIPSMKPSVLPTNQPVLPPTMQPTLLPSLEPSKQPVRHPSAQPLQQPTDIPSKQPIKFPSLTPTMQPSKFPSEQPFQIPSLAPSRLPTLVPIIYPTRQPSRQPFRKPSSQPFGQPSRQPFRCPSRQPSRQPNRKPSMQPSIKPIVHPLIKNPTSQPIIRPTVTPSRQPHLKPSKFPSLQPSLKPTLMPFSNPSSLPTTNPTNQGTISPTSEPSLLPSNQPSEPPSLDPSSCPSSSPTLVPTVNPLSLPSSAPSLIPSNPPTGIPTCQTLQNPTKQPTRQPLDCPSSQPRKFPSKQPSKQPLRKPSKQPMKRPSLQPKNIPSKLPSGYPSLQPTHKPVIRPSSQPSCFPVELPTFQPIVVPSKQPDTKPSRSPTLQNIIHPSNQPSKQPIQKPSKQPIKMPSNQPTIQPVKQPSSQPLQQPSVIPSFQPSFIPSYVPSSFPSGIPINFPTVSPSTFPTFAPSVAPSSLPASSPSRSPSRIPLTSPSLLPTLQKTQNPSNNPSSIPSAQPLHFPTVLPSIPPSLLPSFQPYMSPTFQPRRRPSQQPRRLPTNQPTKQPRLRPSFQPSRIPSTQPSLQPRVQPSMQPNHQPNSSPSTQPRRLPSQQPTLQPKKNPSEQPSSFPQDVPTAQPKVTPSRQPSSRPRKLPSRQPLESPSCQPSLFPTSPSSYPSIQPRNFPSAQPQPYPSQQPIRWPSSRPKSLPTRHPTKQPTSQPSRKPITTIPTTSNPMWTEYTRSRRPSIKPSFFPSSHPSSEPSAMPTRSLASEWLSGQQKFYSKLENSVSSETILEYFGELIINGRLNHGGNKQFLSYLFGDVKNKLSAYRGILSIQLWNFSMPSDYLNSSFISCTDKIPLLQIASRLTNFTANSSLTTIVCNNIPWTINNCGTSHFIKLCANCRDPCTQGSETTISDSCSKTGSCFHALIFSFEDISPVYPVADMSLLKRTETSITILVELKYFAYVYCVATPTQDSLPPVESVLSAGYSQSGNHNLTFSFSSLQPATNFSIVCVSQSESGALIKNKGDGLTVIRASTLCCKVLNVNINLIAILRDNYYPDAIYLTVDAMPSQLLSVDVVPMNGASNNTSKRFCIFSPSPLNIYNQKTNGGIFAIGIKCSVDAVVGMFSFKAILSGSSKDEYHVRYPKGNSFSIINSGYRGKAPGFSTAIFSPSGVDLTLNFTVSTNRALLDENFQCSKFLRFDSVESATCRWVDNATVHISLSAFSTLAVGDSIYISNSPASVETVLNFMEQCPAGLSCKFWPTISFYDRVTIMAPYLPIIPTVVINAPAVVSAFNSFAVDLRSSVGSAGRNWINGTFHVKVAGSAAVNINQVKYVIASQLVFNNYSIVKFPPLTFPSNAIYSITFHLCNWLMVCGSSTYFLTVTDYSLPMPAVFILGNSYRSIKSFHQLNLFADIQYSSPSTYTFWKITQNNVVVNKVSNECNRTLQFHLSANTLYPGQVYQVSFTAVDTNKQVSSSATVNVFVEEMAADDIVAIISQGDALSVGLGQYFKLDAAQSYNRAFVKYSGSPVDGLRFSWSCQVIGYTTREITCPLKFSSSETDLPTLLVSSPTNSSITASEMLVTLAVRKNDFKSLASIKIFLASASRSCMITEIEFSNQNRHVNIGEKLKVKSVIYSNFSQTNYSWSLFDTSGTNFIDAAAMTTTLISSNFANTFLAIDLILRPNVLSPSSTYMLKLSCYHNGNMEAFSTITVTTNSPPRGGTFSSVPTKGKALSTVFNLMASFWISDQLPLQYEFGFISNTVTNIFLPLQEKSDASFTNSILPSLFQNVSSLLNLYVFVSDIMNANSSAYSEVEVEYSSLQFEKLQQLVMNSNSELELSSSLSVFSSQLNSVDCSLSPNCSSLYRAPCAHLQNTCGTCLEGYYGIDSDDNSFCFPKFEKRRRLKSVACDSSSLHSCGPAESCVNGICAMRNKTCIGSCSKRGSCIFYNIYSGYTVDSCLESDFTCASKCVCDSGFSGVVCTDLKEELTSRVRLRNDLVSLFDRSFYFGATELSTIRNWINLAVSLAFQPSELSLHSFNMLVQSVGKILKYAEQFKVNFEDLLRLGTCFNSLVAFCEMLQNKTSSQNPRLQIVDSLLKAWSDAISSDLVFSQSVSDFQKFYRMKIFTLKLQGNISLQEPVSSSEAIAQSYQPQNILMYSTDSLNYSTSDPNEWFALSLFSYSASVFKIDLNTNPIGLYYNNVSSKSLTTTMSTFSAILTLSNYLNIHSELHSSQKIITTCSNKNFGTYSYECGGGFPNIVVTCPGTAVKLINQCPDYRYKPQCLTVNSFGNFSIANTDLLGYTIASTKCQVRSSEYLVRSMVYASATVVSEGIFDQYKQSSTLILHDSNSSGVSTAVITICLGLFVLLVFIIRPNSRNFFQTGENLDKDVVWKKKRVNNQIEIANRKRNGIPKLDIEENRLAIEKLLSPLFLRNDLRRNITLALNSYHSFLGTNIPFVVKLLGGVSSILSFVFWNTLILFFDFQLQDSQCKAMKEVSCNSAKSIFDSNIKRCHWDDFLQSCSYAPAVDSPIILVVFTIMAQCLCIPAVLIVCWILKRSFQMSSRNQLDDFVVNNSKVSSEKKHLVDMAKNVNTTTKRKFLQRIESDVWQWLCARNGAINITFISYLMSKITECRRDSPSVVGQQLLQCFLVESLEYLPAIILQRHFDRLLPPSTTAVSPSMVFSLVTLINVLIFIVAIVLAVNSSQDTQVMFSKCFVCWLVLDVFIVHPFYIIHTFVLLPSLAHSNIYQLLQSFGSIDTDTDSIRTVSQLLATLFPSVRESRFVLSAKVAYPKELSSSANSKSFAWIVVECFVALPHLLQDIVIYYLLTGIVIGIFISVIILVQYNTAMVAIPLLVVGTTCLYVYYIPRSRSVYAESNSSSLSVYTVDVIDMRAQPLVSKDIFDSSLPNSTDQINILPLEKGNLPIPVTLMDIANESIGQVPSSRNKNIVASEESYQAALATGVSTNSGRRLLLRSAAQAMEAGLVDTAKSRLQKSLHGYSNRTLNEYNTATHPPNLWSYSRQSEEKSAFDDERYQLITRGEFAPLPIFAEDLNFESDSDNSWSESSHSNDIESDSHTLAVAAKSDQSNMQLSAQFDDEKMDISSTVSAVLSEALQLRSADTVVSKDNINMEFSSGSNSDSDSSYSLAYDLYD